MTDTAITFNQVSAEVKIFASRASRGGKSGGGSGFKVKGVQDVLAGQSDMLGVMERLEGGSVSLNRKQRAVCTAFVRAVARRRAFEKAQAATRPVIARKAG